MFKVAFQGKVSGVVELERELSLLACATKAEVVLDHLCGGHARCGTCLVSIESGAEKLTEPGLSEQRVLKILKAGPHQRLACQAWAQGDVVCEVGASRKDLRGGR